MRLVHTADRERAAGPAVHCAAGALVLVVKRAAVLIDHNAVLFERLKAVPIKLLCKQPRRMAERIGRVVDDQVVFIEP
ncbi:hypothetical protein SDC9_139465 [bioreactor metagenome]|uniref:Uncharacterized protein n=1 Tax=bioreactor metagenome TaxID=1076179 RepID=A0A645DS68_9ZZZZ